MVKFFFVWMVFTDFSPRVLRYVPPLATFRQISDKHKFRVDNYKDRAHINFQGGRRVGNSLKNQVGVLNVNFCFRGL